MGWKLCSLPGTEEIKGIVGNLELRACSSWVSRVLVHPALAPESGIRYMYISLTLNFLGDFQELVPRDSITDDIALTVPFG